MLSQPQNPSQNPAVPSRKMNRRWLGYVLAFFLATGTFISGVYIGQSSTPAAEAQTASIFSIFSGGSSLAPREDNRPSMEEFWRVWDLLEDKFATASTTKTTVEERLEGAIHGLVEAYGDPYTVYFPPSDAATFDENISGNFSGVGMEVGLRDGFVTVIAPLPDTPAEAAGVLAGDVVVKIDDVSTEGMRIDTAVSLIRGEKGTVVNLQVYREGEFDFIDIPITRDTISIPTVKTEQEGDTFIVSLYSFNAVAEEQVLGALRTYTESGAENLILDLRGNPGGYLQSAVAIAGYFLPSGKVVVKEEFGDETQNRTFRTRGNQIGMFTPKNLVVLVDNGSASASEILAGALRDHGVATVIGSQTFGKGSVQELVKLKDGSSLKVTVARWVTPNNVSISEGGLEPDILITRTPEQRVAGEDTQKDAAIRFLRGEEVVSETFENKVVSVSTESAETGE